ncbi:unnamed protein product [Gongylonema pulchrum]|uniref:Extensin-like n=1 Tax=Gongylonema pulchrum TaxID=637853 RepID=A0A183E6S6_9BILA|nr:unnamed protein product [Gongylonema pulchrum]
MERMTQDSLFEPPSKICRSSSESIQPAKREQDRNAKLEKMRTLEQQIMYDKAKTEWDRMMHETRGAAAAPYMPPMMPNCSSQAVAPAPQYPCFANPDTGVMMQESCRRPVCPQQMPPAPPPPPAAAAEPASSVPPSLPMMVSLPQTSAHSMPASQPLRPSLNPSGCGVQYAPHNGFMYCPYPQNVYPPAPQGYHSAISSPYFPSSFPADGAAPQQSRDYGMYQQGMRTMCPPEKLGCEMWGRQLTPANEFDNRFPNQKLQYHPNGAIMDEKMMDAVAASTNPMFA